MNENSDQEKKYLEMKKEYWKCLENLNKAEELKQKMLSIDIPETRYFIWVFCVSYGWRQLGCMSGYKTLEELKQEHTFKCNREAKNPIIIMRGIACETYEINDYITIINIGKKNEKNKMSKM